MITSPEELLLLEEYHQELMRMLLPEVDRYDTKGDYSHSEEMPDCQY